MGCDIHAYVEYVSYTTHEDEPVWDCLMQNIGNRDYDFFSVLSNCGRGSFQPLFTPRGLPDDLGHTVKGEMWVTVTDDKEIAEERGYCTKEQAESWADYHPSGIQRKELGAKEDGTPRYLEQVMHPDLHGHTWLTCEELGQVIAWWITSSCSDYPYGVEWDAALAAMRALEERGHKTRVVIAFDN